jgi:hypothetical protein
MRPLAVIANNSRDPLIVHQSCFCRSQLKGEPPDT